MDVRVMHLQAVKEIVSCLLLTLDLAFVKHLFTKSSHVVNFATIHYIEANEESKMKFRKMHGLGNDFVVLDARIDAIHLTPEIVARIGDRHCGVGFDQLVTLHNVEGASVQMDIWNSDGSQAEACGNATRCVADLIMSETGESHAVIRTVRGDLEAARDGDMIAINMGHPILDWKEIPLAKEVDVDALPIDGAPLATSMGNPHCTFFVDDVMDVDLETFGPKIENDPLYPAKTNVQIASLIAPDHLRMRVWERGVGITLASGSSSCATAVAAARRGMTSRKVQITLDGGDIFIDWRDDGVWMMGPVAYVFDGEFDDRFLA